MRYPLSGEGEPVDAWYHPSWYPRLQVPDREARTGPFARNLRYWTEYGFGLWILRELGGGGTSGARPD